MTEPVIVKCDKCGWTGDSKKSLHNHNWQFHSLSNPNRKEPPVVEKPPVEIPAEPADEKPPEKILTRKEEFERDHNVIIPDLEEDDDDEPVDAAKFDGEEPEIPFVFIMVAVVVLMIIAGAVIFREKIIGLFKPKKPLYGVPDYVES